MVKSVEEWLTAFEGKDLDYMTRLVLGSIPLGWATADDDVDSVANAFIAYATLSRRARMAP